MLEKTKSKRPFIIDLFKYFPHNHLKLMTLEDKDNYKIYCDFKEDLERKRLIDSNKYEII
jgi:hypothetical protein